MSGDFLDAVQTDDLSVHVVVGDVSGHGAAEAALGVHLRMAWRTAVLCGKSQLEQLYLMERMLADERADDHTYATVLSLVFPPDRLTVRAVSAGHHGFLLRRAHTVRWLEPRIGIALGLLPERADWQETVFDILEEDGLVTFTDGLFEGKTSASSRLGEAGLHRLATRHALLPPEEFVDALVADVTALAAPYGGLSDDVAVLHLGWKSTRTRW
ncbi:PP2C family protein-serine/threonine phosphatase [Streptomyces zhihengii]|uniref:PP2C family protein-serine/threonine phosphatase n=1 Tax=Streptomyces zhihengii TaxID=1818004 RepID=UPI0033AABCEE